MEVGVPICPVTVVMRGRRYAQFVRKRHAYLYAPNSSGFIARNANNEAYTQASVKAMRLNTVLQQTLFSPRNQAHAHVRY